MHRYSMSGDGKSLKKHSSIFIRDSKTPPQSWNKSGGCIGTVFFTPSKAEHGFPHRPGTEHTRHITEQTFLREFVLSHSPSKGKERS